MGPAVWVTAAFIGPGTVVTASVAGAHYGYALLWALLFAMCATLTLQEMSLRLGMVTRQGLGENIRQHIKPRWLRRGCAALVLAAVVVGNAAYQGGNIAGASMGLETLVNPEYGLPFPLLLSVAAFFLLWFGTYRYLQRVLVCLVLMMSASFIAALVLVRPHWSLMLEGMFLPSVPTGALLTVVALVGTSVVPYNLFLHASTVIKRWANTEQLPAARRDLFVAVPLGTLMSMAILATSASAFFGALIPITGAKDIAPALAPVFGPFASWAMALGLLAAGLSSALTAPLAAAYALTGILGKAAQPDSYWFRGTWLLVLGVGGFAASLGYRPVSLIMVAQTTNGVLLPVLAMFLLWLANHRIMGQFRNRWWHNVLGGTVILVTCLLGARMLGMAWGWL